MPGLNVSDEEVIGFVTEYLDSAGLDSSGVTMASSLDELGLDSIATVELMITAREQLVDDGRLAEDVSLKGLPKLETVQDLVALLRTFSAETA